MPNCTFNRGGQLSIDGQLCTIIWVLPDDRYQLEKEDKSVVLVSKTDLLKLYSEMRLEFVVESKVGSKTGNGNLKRPLQTFSSSVSAAAIRRKKYVDFIGQFGRLVSSPQILKGLITECAQVIGDKNPPSPVSLYRWWKKYSLSGFDYRALIDRFHARGRAGQRYDEDVFGIVKSAVESVYLNGQRESVEDVCAAVEAQIFKENEWRTEYERLKVPSKASIYRYVRSLDQYEVTVARFGKEIADIKFRTSTQGPKTTRILERVEIDHTPLDLFVLDLATGLPLGRPTVTLILDRHSRMVLGFHIGFQNTSLESVYHALRHAILVLTQHFLLNSSR